MTRLVFDWPDEAGEGVRAARGRLARVADALAETPFEERLRSVSRVLEAWTAADSPWRRELSATLGARGPFHPRTLEEGLESGLRAWDPARFRDCARAEIEGARRGGRLTLAPYECTSVIAGGSIPMPTLLSGLLPLVLGSPVLLRETSKDPVTASLLARSLASLDEGLAHCLEVVRFPVEDTAAMTELLASPCVVATGSDETLDALRSQLSASQRFVAYGHRFSLAILGPATPGEGAELDAIAAGIALDVARWDQSGCLSPAFVYLVGQSNSTQEAVAGAIAAALEQLGDALPRGKVPTETLATQATERSDARMRAAAGRGARVFEGNDFSVILESDERPRPAPLARFVRLHPLPDLEALGRALAPFAPHLSNVAIAGFEAPGDPRLSSLLSRAGFSRITTPGRLQTPPVDWPHDGMPLFLPMARFLEAELDFA